MAPEELNSTCTHGIRREICWTCMAPDASGTTSFGTGPVFSQAAQYQEALRDALRVVVRDMDGSILSLNDIKKIAKKALELPAPEAIPPAEPVKEWGVRRGKVVFRYASEAMARYIFKMYLDSELVSRDTWPAPEPGPWKPEGFQHMSTAPRTSEWITVITDTGEEVQAHYASDLSGESQPAFQGWFVRSGEGFREIKPVGWKPLC